MTKSIQFADVSILAAFEASLRTHLMRLLNPLNIAVDEFPADPLQLNQPPVQSRVLIAFVNQSHERIASPDSWNRTQTVRKIAEFDINYDLISLRSHSAVYFLIDQVSNLLEGWIPQVTIPEGININLEPCQVVTDSFRQLVDGNSYLYATRIRIPYVSVVERRITDPVQLKSLGIAIHRAEINDLDDSVLDIILSVPTPETP